MDSQAEQPSGQTIRAEDIVAAHQAAKAKVVQDPFQEMSADARTMVLAMARAADAENAANEITVSKNELEKNEPAKEALTESRQNTTSKIALVAEPSLQLDEDTHSSSNCPSEISIAKFNLSLRSAFTLYAGLQVMTASSPEEMLAAGIAMACWGFFALRAFNKLRSFDNEPEDKRKPVSNLDD